MQLSNYKTITQKNNDYEMSSGPIWPKWNHENEKIVLFAASLPENDQNIMKIPSFEYIADTKEKLRMEPLYQ